ncbi:stress-inducible protein [Streptomyces sp. Act143]|uniref:universal stress protein n=1 Tax=Streptomyces sp. Act143 TaxID=2200760 RepID=UPI000D67E9A9|nr:universal stress protein [Streptomyces sp. Act143]PWI13263.1 stress-inducible protein [Streptomyces sp. Act143]
MPRPVVVGLDGSRESLAAAEWAAREALRRGLPLRLVHAWEGGATAGEPGLPELAAPRYWSERILRGGLDRLGESYPQVRLSADQVPHSAPDALVAVGDEAELLVLGSRAFSGFGGFMAGSVALATVARVTRPVVLVRAHQRLESEHLPDAGGGPSVRTPYREVVVGVDPAHRCDELLAFAFESAAMRSAPLRALFAWRMPYVQSAAEAKVREAMGRHAERALRAVLGPWREKFPLVEISEITTEGRAAERLTHAAQDAGLLVVGRKIRPARVGTHTGPVAHAVMHHARCPVAVVAHE